MCHSVFVDADSLEIPVRLHHQITYQHTLSQKERSNKATSTAESNVTLHVLGSVRCLGGATTSRKMMEVCQYVFLHYMATFLGRGKMWSKYGPVKVQVRYYCKFVENF